MGTEEQGPTSGPHAEVGGTLEGRVPFQDRMENNYCWGCGRLNDKGLQIKSRWDGEEGVCTWRPQEFHAAGPRDVLSGGIIASIIDCHSVCTAVADAYRFEGRHIGSDPEICTLLPT